MEPAEPVHAVRPGPMLRRERHAGHQVVFVVASVPSFDKRRGWSATWRRGCRALDSSAPSRRGRRPSKPWTAWPAAGSKPGGSRPPRGPLPARAHTQSVRHPQDRAHDISRRSRAHPEVQAARRSKGLPEPRHPRRRERRPTRTARAAAGAFSPGRTGHPPGCRGHATSAAGSAPRGGRARNPGDAAGARCTSASSTLCPTSRRPSGDGRGFSAPGARPWRCRSSRLRPSTRTLRPRRIGAPSAHHRRRFRPMTSTA